MDMSHINWTIHIIMIQIPMPIFSHQATTALHSVKDAGWQLFLTKSKPMGARKYWFTAPNWHTFDEITEILYKKVMEIMRNKRCYEKIHMCEWVRLIVVTLTWNIFHYVMSD